MSTFLLYGANGYTGELIIRYAVQQGMKPIIAGRNEEKIKALAEKYELEYRVFDLKETEKLYAALREVKVVLHAAGPFMYTAKQMIMACLETNTHYLDITGEIGVFEYAASADAAAKRASIMIMSGVGFDVVPTDCMAMYLKEQMPDAEELKLAFAGDGGVSHGTASTMIENIESGGAIRKGGKIVIVPSAYKTAMIPFSHKTLHAMTIPWGDVSTAYYSTGIENIETYMAVPPKSAVMAKRATWFRWLLKRRWVKNLLISRVKKGPAGPSDERRAKTRSYVWGEVTNKAGNKIAATLDLPEGYTLTALSALIIVKKVLAGNAPHGFQTPSKVYGAGLVLEIEGVVRSKK